MSNRRRPSVSNVLAVLAALWVGATCGCTYVAPTPITPPLNLSCLVLVSAARTDSVTLGVYEPPCGQEPDSVFYWRLPLPRECAIRATIETPRGHANVQSLCPSAPLLPRG